ARVTVAATTIVVVIKECGMVDTVLVVVDDGSSCDVREVIGMVATDNRLAVMLVAGGGDWWLATVMVVDNGIGGSSVDKGGY
ncbi:hypothetical protein HAX54_001378, partial [Datura stramonium]|nr:hypothetical protein [Datura stramonium]